MSRIRIPLLEAFSNDIVNNVQFSQTKLTDAHIQKIIQEVSKVTGAPIRLIEKEIEGEVMQWNFLKGIAPILYSTIAENAIEGEVFRLMERLKIKHPDSSKFSQRVFFELVDWIKAEHHEFFPVKDIRTNRGLREVFRFVPSDTKEYQNVKTAAATDQGVFIFNVDFCQTLMEFANFKSLQPKSKKYRSNGGPIPDDYCLIEFVIIHEFMHYTQADWHIHKTLNKKGELVDMYELTPKIANWTADFRNNYTLVKHGHFQIPGLLYSRDINYDKQNTFKQMVDIVKSEFAKLNKFQQSLVSSALDGMTDDHSHGESGQGEGEGSGSGESNGKADSDKPQGDLTGKDPDAVHKEISKQLGNKKEDSAPPKVDLNQKPNGNPGFGGSNMGTSKVEWKYTPPKFSWPKLLDKIISNQVSGTEETYLKPSNSATTSVSILGQTGKAVVKPGEIKTEAKLKVCVLVDSSGSMSGVISAVFNEITSLLKKYRRLDNTFGFMRFSDGFELFKVNIGKQTYGKVTRLTDKAKLSEGNVKTLFSEHYGSGTNFSGSLAAKCQEIISDGYFLIVISDSDILHSTNLINFRTVISSKMSAAIFSDKECYIQALKSIGARSNITFFS